jgi:hypothetical protein
MRTPSLESKQMLGTATGTTLVAATGDEIFVIIDAFLDEPAGHANPTFSMSIGGSTAAMPIMLITEPSHETNRNRKLPSVRASTVAETSVTLQWSLALKCPVSRSVTLHDHQGSTTPVDCAASSAAATGLSYQVFSFATSSILPGQQITSPCGLDFNARRDVNGPFPFGYTLTPGRKCVSSFYTINADTVESCVLECDQSSCGGFTYIPQTSTAGASCLIMTGTASSGGCDQGPADASVQMFTRDTTPLDLTEITVTNLAPGTQYTFVVMARDPLGGERMTYAPLHATTAARGSGGTSGSVSNDSAAAAVNASIIAIVVAGLLLVLLAIAVAVSIVVYVKVRRMRAVPNYTLTDMSGLSALTTTMPSEIREAPLMPLIDDSTHLGSGDYDMTNVGGDFALMDDDDDGDTTTRSSSSGGTTPVAQVYANASAQGSLLSRF